MMRFRFHFLEILTFFHLNLEGQKQSPEPQKYNKHTQKPDRNLQKAKHIKKWFEPHNHDFFNLVLFVPFRGTQSDYFEPPVIIFCKVSSMFFSKKNTAWTTHYFGLIGFERLFEWKLMEMNGKNRPEPRNNYFVFVCFYLSSFSVNKNVRINGN